MAGIRRSGGRRLIDAAGQQRAAQRVHERHKQAMAELAAHAAKTKVAVPILETSEDIVEVVSSKPEYPFYKLAKNLGLQAIGEAVLGEGGFNRASIRPNASSLGPHFDDYRGGFSPWALLVNKTTSVYVEGAFLSERAWDEYQTQYPDHDDRHEMGAQWTRSKLGKAALEATEELFVTLIGANDKLLLWQGGDSPEARIQTPGVHDFQRPILENGNAGYGLYVHSTDPDIPYGYIEI